MKIATDGRCLGGRGCCLRSHVSADRYQHGGLLVQKIGGLTGQPLVLAVCPTVPDGDIRPLELCRVRPNLCERRPPDARFPWPTAH